MLEYKQVKNGDRTSYLKNNKFVKPDRVPAEVLEKFDYTDVVKYDDQPDKNRCLFCDAPFNRKRVVNRGIHGVQDLKTVELCDNHYYSSSLGSIVAKLNLIDKEIADGSNIKSPTRGRAKRKQRSSVKG